MAVLRTEYCGLLFVTSMLLAACSSELLRTSSSEESLALGGSPAPATCKLKRQLEFRPPHTSLGTTPPSRREEFVQARQDLGAEAWRVGANYLQLELHQDAQLAPNTLPNYWYLGRAYRCPEKDVPVPTAFLRYGE